MTCSSVLIVEDEIFIAVEMEEIIRDLGHRPVGIADDLDSAMAKASNDIDIALVDVNLADGATGPVIGAKLAGEYAIQVVFVTANPTQLGDGVEGTLGAVEKPVGMDRLKEVLDYVAARTEDATTPAPATMKLFG